MITSMSTIPYSLRKIFKHTLVAESSPSYNTNLSKEAESLETALRFELELISPANHIFAEYVERLDQLVSLYTRGVITLSRKLSGLNKISADLDEAYIQMEHTGLDVTQFAIFEISKTYIQASNFTILQNFSADIVSYIHHVLPSKWRLSRRRDVYIADIRKEVISLLIGLYAKDLRIRNLHAYLDDLIRVIIRPRNKKHNSNK